MALLEAHRLVKYFGGLRAVSELSLTVAPGEIVGLIGPNGSGKTTTFNLLSGFADCDAGVVEFGGEEISGLPPHSIVAKGLVRTWQDPRLFGDLSVAENVLLGLRRLPGSSLGSAGFGNYRQNLTKSREEAGELLGIAGLEAQGQERAGNLPYGMQKMVGVLRAIASGPSTVLLDEPVAGLSAAEVTKMLNFVSLLREERGTSVLLVEHNLEAVLSVCDRIVVMDAGAKLAEGRPEEIKLDPDVIRVYIGDAAPRG